MTRENIYVIYGQNYEEMVISLLDSIDLSGDIARLSIKDPLIAIKPNLVVAQISEWGATTSPVLVKGVIRYLKQNGFNNIAIMESSWVGDCTKLAYKECGYEKLSREFNVPLIDLKDDEAVSVSVGDLNISVCKSVLNADYLINMPVLKAHCQTKITCALKNLKGCIPDSEKRRFHRIGLHKPIAALSKALPVNLVIVDSLNGDLCHEEGGNPVRMDRVFAGKDPVLIDAYACELLGYNTEEIPYIAMSRQLKVGSDKLMPDTVVELNKNTAPAKVLPSRETDLLSKYIIENEACSACYSSLVHALKRVKEKRSGKLPQISTGQGFIGLSGKLGVGDCTSCFDRYVPGCPPKTKDIIKMLEYSN